MVVIFVRTVSPVCSTNTVRGAILLSILFRDSLIVRWWDISHGTQVRNWPNTMSIFNHQRLSPWFDFSLRQIKVVFVEIISCMRTKHRGLRGLVGRWTISFVTGLYLHSFSSSSGSSSSSYSSSIKPESFPTCTVCSTEPSEFFGPLIISLK